MTTGEIAYFNKLTQIIPLHNIPKTIANTVGLWYNQSYVKSCFARKKNGQVEKSPCDVNLEHLHFLTAECHFGNPSPLVFSTVFAENCVAVVFIAALILDLTMPKEKETKKENKAENERKNK